MRIDILSAVPGLLQSFFEHSILHRAAKRGLLLLTCGSYGNVLRVMIPLTIEDAILDEGMAILEAAMEVAAKA